MTTTSTARSRAFRERRKCGAVVITLEVSPALIDALIDGMFLAEWDETSPVAIRKAIERLHATLILGNADE